MNVGEAMKPLERLEAVDNLMIGILTRRVGDFRKALVEKGIGESLADGLTEKFFQSAVDEHMQAIKITADEWTTLTNQLLQKR